MGGVHRYQAGNHYMGYNSSQFRGNFFFQGCVYLFLSVLCFSVLCFKSCYNNHVKVSEFQVVFLYV